ENDPMPPTPSANVPGVSTTDVTLPPPAESCAPLAVARSPPHAATSAASTPHATDRPIVARVIEAFDSFRQVGRPGAAPFYARVTSRCHAIAVGASARRTRFVWEL